MLWDLIPKQQRAGGRAERKAVKIGGRCNGVFGTRFVWSLSNLRSRTHPFISFQFAPGGFAPANLPQAPRKAPMPSHLRLLHFTASLFPAFLLTTILAGQLAAQENMTELLTIPGGGAGGGAGESIGLVNNLRVVGAPFDNAAGTEAGSVGVHSATYGDFIILGNAPGERFGFSVAALEDVDLDGIPDIAVGAPLADHNGADSGSVYIYSGATRALLYRLDGAAAGDQTGYSLASMGDLNGDGRGDFIVGSPYNDTGATDGGRVRIHAGHNGAVFTTINGASANAHFGFSVAGGRDADSDGIPDFVVGTPDLDNTIFLLTNIGNVKLYSGATFALLKSFSGGQSNERLGYSVGLGMIGYFCAGSPGDNGGGAGAGSLSIYHTSSASVVATKNGAAGEHLGTSCSFAFTLLPPSSPPVHYFAAGGPNATGAAGQVNAGIVRIIDTTGAELENTKGSNANDRLGASVAAAGFGLFAGVPGLNSTSNKSGAVYYREDLWGAQKLHLLQIGHLHPENLGYALANAGDFDSDGRDDVLAGAPGAASGGLLTGAVSIYSTATGAPIVTTFGNQALARFGESVAMLGDTNGDGKPEFLGGAPKYDVSGILVDAGRVSVCNGANGTILYSINGGASGDALGTSLAGGGDVNADGKPDFIVGIPGRDATGSNAGEIKVINGLNGLTIFTLDGDGAGDKLGTVVSYVGDYNNDGRVDFAATAPFFTTFLSSGLIRIYSGVNGSVLQNIQIGSAFNEGISFASIADMTLDGHPEMLTGALNDLASGGAANAGGAYLLDGSSGAVLRSHTTNLSDLQIGWAVGAAGDNNKDGVPEYIYVNGNLYLGGSIGGIVKLVDGFSGAVIAHQPGASAGLELGRSVAMIHDLSGDGLDEVAAGAPLADGIAIDSGAVFIETYAPMRLTRYGNGTPGCFGYELPYANETPIVPSPDFTISVTNCPPDSLLLGIATDVPLFAAADQLGIGVLLSVNLIASSEVILLDVPTDSAGRGHVNAPIPPSAALQGKHYYFQSLGYWGGGPCTPSPVYNLSSSIGLDIWIQ